MSPTRREFLSASAAAALAAALGRPRPAHAQQQAAQPAFTQLRANVGYFTMRGGTIGYLVNARAVVVVDSQYPEEAKACLEGVNKRSSGRPVDFLINTHHHLDHTGGNVSFKGIAKNVVAQEKAAQLMKNPPGFDPPGADQLLPDLTFEDKWQGRAGEERVSARFYGPAHTSGDAVITFERANIVHMGDLMFNQRHPVVDRAAGASIRNWMKVLENTVDDHSKDTIYIFGHAKMGLPVTGNRDALNGFRSYLGALLAFVEAQVKAGKSRDEVLAMREPLAGFESYGPFGQPGPRDALTCAYEEVTAA